MKKALSIGGGVVGFLVGVILYVLMMEIAFETDRFSTKIGALFAIGGAIAGSSLGEKLAGGKKDSSGAGGSSGPRTAEDRAREERLWKAVQKNDPEEIEGLRDVIRPVDVGPLAARFRSSLDWNTKEALIALLTDQTAKQHPELEPIFKDGLSAPTFEVRCYSYCSLTGDFESFPQILEGGDSVIQEKLKARGLA